MAAQVQPVACAGQTTGRIDAGIVSGGQAPYSYQWSNGASGPVAKYLSPGVYALYLTDAAGCADTSFYNVQQTSVLNVNFLASADTVQMGNSLVTFTNLSSGYTSLSWDFGDSNISSSVNPSHWFMGAGTYTVALNATDGTCFENVKKNVVVLAPNGIAESKLTNKVVIYNQGMDWFVKFDLDKSFDAGIKIMDAGGKQIYSRLVSAEKNAELLTFDAAQGIYMVEVDLAGERISKKILK